MIKKKTYIQEEDKEKAHRKIWQNIYKISDENNAQYDQDNKQRIIDYLNNNVDKITPFRISDLNRLHNQGLE